jgi:hypothetical protein
MCCHVELSGVPESAVGSGVGGEGEAWGQGWGDGVLSPLPPIWGAAPAFPGPHGRPGGSRVSLRAAGAGPGQPQDGLPWRGGLGGCLSIVSQEGAALSSFIQ